MKNNAQLESGGSNRTALWRYRLLRGVMWLLTAAAIFVVSWINITLPWSQLAYSAFYEHHVGEAVVKLAIAILSSPLLAYAVTSILFSGADAAIGLWKYRK